MPMKEYWERDRTEDGRIRKIRGDALLKNVALDVWNKIDARSDITVREVLRRYDVTSVSQLREKLRSRWLWVFPVEDGIWFPPFNQPNITSDLTLTQRLLSHFFRHT